MDQRRFKSHKRNLDSEVTSVIRCDENVEREKSRNGSVSPFNNGNNDQQLSASKALNTVRRKNLRDFEGSTDNPLNRNAYARAESATERSTSSNSRVAQPFLYSNLA
jgi:hypothetical protein